MKLSVSLPEDDIAFVDDYACAFAEWGQEADNSGWENAVADGLGT